MSVRRVYETTIIFNAALEDQDIEAAINKVTIYLETHGGAIKEADKWGRKRLAYPINKKFNGFYCHFIFEAVPEIIPVFERFLVLEDMVLRHLTLILPDKLREFRSKRELEEGLRREAEEGGGVSDSNKKEAAVKTADKKEATGKEAEKSVEAVASEDNTKKTEPAPESEIAETNTEETSETVETKESE